MDILREQAATISSQLANVHHVCERQAELWYAEPLNLISNLAFLWVAWLVYQTYRQHPDLKGRPVYDLHALTALIAMIGLGSMAFHSFPNAATEMMDVIPIVVFIVLFFLSIIIRIGRTTHFQTVVCFLAFVGSSHMLVTQFPHAMNDSIGYLSSMGALLMIAIYLHLMKRRSAQQFMMAAALGMLSLFFRVIDREVCAEIPVGTHFLWHSLNAWLIYIIMKQLIRNVNREARLERLRRVATHKNWNRSR